MLDKYLAKFDRMLGHTPHYDGVRQAYERVFAWEAMGELPFVWGAGMENAPGLDRDWPDYAYNDAFFDPEMMLLSQLRGPFLHYQLRDYAPLAIRANYGTVILPSIFGADYQLTETSLPWAHHLPDRAAILRLIERGVPDFCANLGDTCFQTAEYYMEALAPYPNLAREVQIYHPDLQGPFDVAHLLWGPDIFVALYDCPVVVHALLDLVVETYIAWLTRWKAVVGEDNDFTAHWSVMMRGGAMIRDDTPVMISGEQYQTFVKPYDQMLLDAFGGCIHFCGRGDQFIESMADSHRLYGINSSQPELNDMARLWQACQWNHLVLLDLKEEHLPPGATRGVTVRRTWQPSPS